MEHIQTLHKLKIYRSIGLVKDNKEIIFFHIQLDSTIKIKVTSKKENNITINIEKKITICTASLAGLRIKYKLQIAEIKILSCLRITMQTSPQAEETSFIVHCDNYGRQIKKKS